MNSESWQMRANCGKARRDNLQTPGTSPKPFPREQEMTRQLSFTKYERKILPDYRQRISSAETVQEVKNFFVYMVELLLQDVFAAKLNLEENDIRLTPRQPGLYQISPRLRETPEFTGIWETSDLSDVLDRMAEMACNRCRHLEKQPEKIPSKIRK
jgi:hypothetical protein